MVPSDVAMVRSGRCRIDRQRAVDKQPARSHGCDRGSAAPLKTGGFRAGKKSRRIFSTASECRESEVRFDSRHDIPGLSGRESSNLECHELLVQDTRVDRPNSRRTARGSTRPRLMAGDYRPAFLPACGPNFRRTGGLPPRPAAGRTGGLPRRCSSRGTT